jgi:hypothetical protein
MAEPLSIFLRTILRIRKYDSEKRLKSSASKKSASDFVQNAPREGDSMASNYPSNLWRLSKIYCRLQVLRIPKMEAWGPD